MKRGNYLLAAAVAACFSGFAHSEEATELEPMRVSAPATVADEGYNVTVSSTATKTDTPIMETPFSIQVVPQEVIQDQQAYTLDQALRNVSNLRVLESPYSGIYSNIQSRGFNAELFRDGVRIKFLTTPMANVERVEVLKGPAAIEFGRVEPGGMVNVITKKPLDTAHYSVEQQFGSWDLSRTTVDFTGPLDEGKTLLYRMNGEYTDQNTFVDHTFGRREFYAPTLSWRPTDKTNITLSYEYRNEHEQGPTGIPILSNNRPANVKDSSFYGQPGLQNHFNVDAFNLTGEQKINENWTLRGAAGKWRGKYHYQNVVNSQMSDDVTLERWGLGSDYDHRDTNSYNLDLEGKFNTLGVQHTMLLGTDYFKFQQNANWADWAVPAISIYHPDFNLTSKSELLSQPVTSWYRTNQSWHGYYLQDQMTIAERWHLLLGGRYDNTDMSSGYSGVSMADAKAMEETKREHKFSPRVGLTYQVNSWLNVYGSYTEAFGGFADTTRTKDGNMVKPQSSDQYEAGAKTEFFDGRLSATMAVYQLTKKHISTPDPSDPLYVLDIGEAQSKGVEFDVSGKLNANLSAIASYAYNDTEITQSNIAGEQGNRFPNAPRNSGSLWLKYDFLEDMLSGLSLGGGVFAAGSVEGDTANSFKLPGYARLDAFAAYKYKIGQRQITAQLNVNNLLDKTYYNAGENLSRGAVFVAQPMNVIGSIRLDF